MAASSTAPAYALPIEAPLLDLQKRLDEILAAASAAGIAPPPEAVALERQIDAERAEIFSHLTPWQKVLLARHPARPYTMDYIRAFVDEANRRIAESVEYNPDITNLHWAGQFENRNRAFDRLGLVVPLALLVMFILLILAFGKVRQAALLMSVLPLALFGGMLALNVRGMTLNVSSAVGFIALVGVAMQNGVIMISHINNLRREGLDLHNAVVKGASHRMRPVLLTASVAVLGLFPASISTGIGSDVQRPLATVIVYGLLFATVITLYILPTLYYMVERRKERK